MKKLAIIGASYLQDPLIIKAKNMGIETHVFAWKEGAVGAKNADFFYPISITEKEKILEKCKEIGINGICSIASDLATIAVNYVAYHMGLVGNSLNCTRLTTNKHSMRERFFENNDPSPRSVLIKSNDHIREHLLRYPIIVKPVDRSGSRGITKLLDDTGLDEAIEYAMAQGFQKDVLIEEFVEGKEYSIECISWHGQHYFLSMTQKYTTGEPNFIEKAHLEPAFIKNHLLEQVKRIVFHALDSLEIMYGASHTEVKIMNDDIKIIEIGARMGGDCIGSDLVELSTGIDFVQSVIQIALGIKPDLKKKHKNGAAAVRYIFSNEDILVFDRVKSEHPEYIVRAEIKEIENIKVADSSKRFGYYLLQANSGSELEAYLPAQVEE